ncbi:MAG: TIM barrel protein [Chryseolinea sp.]
MSLTRRKFLAASALSSTAAILNNSLETLAKPMTTQNTTVGFELLILATNWGYEGTWDEFCTKIKKLGYDGAEVWCPTDASERKLFVETFQKHNLKFGFLVGGSDTDHAKHLQQFRSSLDMAVTLKPLYINCHSGRDHFSFDQNKQFIDYTAIVSAKTGIPVYHETHRSRILYSAPVARQFMEKIEALRITLDISHWCNVHESLLTDQSETVALTLSRTGHIHARVGHPEGPQVSDPRAPEWKTAFDAHLAWWDKIVQTKRTEGNRLTILTEFGPADYMPTIPYTRQPVANQWEINKFMLDILRERYA